MTRLDLRTRSDNIHKSIRVLMDTRHVITSVLITMEAIKARTVTIPFASALCKTLETDSSDRYMDNIGHEGKLEYPNRVLRLIIHGIRDKF